MDKLTAELTQVVRRHGARSDEEAQQEVREIEIVVGRRFNELVQPIETGRKDIIDALTDTVRSTRVIKRRQTLIMAALLVLAVAVVVALLLDPR